MNEKLRLWRVRKKLFTFSSLFLLIIASTFAISFILVDSSILFTNGQPNMSYSQKLMWFLAFIFSFGSTLFLNFSLWQNRDICSKITIVILFLAINLVSKSIFIGYITNFISIVALLIISHRNKISKAPLADDKKSAAIYISVMLSTTFLFIGFWVIHFLSKEYQRIDHIFESIVAIYSLPFIFMSNSLALILYCVQNARKKTIEESFKN